MVHNPKKSFQELFKDHKYVSVKNCLYNYLLCKRAIEKCLKDDHPELMLQVGSGISPLVTDRSNIVYSDSEMFRTRKKPQGRLILTVPHRKRYCGYEDRYVKHYRRYELLEISVFFHRHFN